MIMNEKINDTTKRILQEGAVHTCKCVRNSIDTTGITESQFENFYGEKLKIIGLFLEFERIVYVTNGKNLRSR